MWFVITVTLFITTDGGARGGTTGAPFLLRERKASSVIHSPSSDRLRSGTLHKGRTLVSPELDPLPGSRSSLPLGTGARRRSSWSGRKCSAGLGVTHLGRWESPLPPYETQGKSDYCSKPIFPQNTNEITSR